MFQSCFTAPRTIVDFRPLGIAARQCMCLTRCRYSVLRRTGLKLVAFTYQSWRPPHGMFQYHRHLSVPSRRTLATFIANLGSGRLCHPPSLQTGCLRALFLPAVFSPRLSSSRLFPALLILQLSVLPVHRRALCCPCSLSQPLLLFLLSRGGPHALYAGHTRFRKPHRTTYPLAPR